MNQGRSCDEWQSLLNVTCGELRVLGYDCRGCACDREEVTRACPAIGGTGRNCDAWIAANPRFSCAGLEAAEGVLQPAGPWPVAR